MVDPDEAAERRLLRSIRWRNALKGLVVVVPVLGLWWLLRHQLIRRYGVEPNLANFGTLLPILFCFGILSRRLGLEQVSDPRETPRLRWLQKQSSARMTSRSRRIQIAGISLALLLWVPIMLFDSSGSSDFTNGWFVLLILMSGSSPSILSRLPKTMDEPERGRYLASTQRAYAVTVSSSVGALVLERYWPGHLAATISLALLIGILTQQIGLEMHRTPAVAPDERIA